MFLRTTSAISTSRKQTLETEEPLKQQRTDECDSDQNRGNRRHRRIETELQIRHDRYRKRDRPGIDQKQRDIHVVERKDEAENHAGDDAGPDDRQHDLPKNLGWRCAQRLGGLPQTWIELREARQRRANDIGQHEQEKNQKKNQQYTQ